MVSDKFQVRSTGPINAQTKQPIKGRKVGGGIRFGEMERDALIAHGCSYLTYDRLHLSSDYFVGDVCCKCGQLITTTRKPIVSTSMGGHGGGGDGKEMYSCLLCGEGSDIKKLALPYVFKFLVTELASVNIKCVLDVDRYGSRGGVKH